ncbi:hypothetical protein [Streptomyces prunicolor]|uniref:hypothetical protein n=1 Tax=Streptomyces prunicolor TaxID=67348 RepID=UPI003430F6A0
MSTETADTSEDSTPPCPSTWNELVDVAPSAVLMPRPERVSTILPEGATGKKSPLEAVVAPGAFGLQDM